jgi:glycosyltransferase involved in cell wall biosynthesis
MNLNKFKKLAPISVVIPCYRCAETIEASVRSIYSQSILPSEIILVEDFSDDNGKTAFEIEKLIKFFKAEPTIIRYLRLSENNGPGFARNLGWDSASQPWIAFLDADDIWHPQKIEIQFSWLEKNPDIFFCAHDTELWEDVFPVYGDKFEPRRLSFTVMLFKNSIPTRSVMVRKDIAIRFESKDYTEDYLLWLLIIGSGLHCYKLPVVLAYSLRPEFSSGGYSSDLWKHEVRELKCFNYLRSRGYISALNFLIVCAFSIIKLCRRLVKAKLA